MGYCSEKIDFLAKRKLPIIVVGSLKSEKNIYRIINFIPYSNKSIKRERSGEKNDLCTCAMSDKSLFAKKRIIGIKNIFDVRRMIHGTTNRNKETF